MMVRRSVARGIWRFVALIGGITYALVIIAVLNSGLSFNYIVLLIISIIIVLLCLKNKHKILIFLKKNKGKVRVMMVVLIIIGFAMRFSFLLMGDRFSIDSVLSDTGVHWYGAQQIVNDGQFDKEVGDYESIFPYLSAYTGVVSISMSIFGNGYFSVLFLNILFDLVSCLALFILFYKWKGDKDVAIFASMFWALNPLQIVFCSLPLAIIVVNTCVILSILFTYLLFYYRDDIIKLCLFSAVCGIVFAIGNAFRPIFIIFLLATIFYWIMISLKRKSCLKKPVISCLLIIVFYFVAGMLPGIIHTQINPYYHGEKARPGWGVYVGANYKTKGRWSSDDRDLFFGPVLLEQSNGDVEDAQSRIMSAAIGRYAKIILNGNLVHHFLNKISVVFGDVKNSIYDFPYVFNVSNSNSAYMFIQDLISVFYYLVLFILGYATYRMVRSKEYLEKKGFVNYLVVLFVGLFAAYLLVESMNRYCLPFVAILSLIALGLVFRGNRHNCDII